MKRKSFRNDVEKQRKLLVWARENKNRFYDINSLAAAAMEEFDIPYSSKAIVIRYLKIELRWKLWLNTVQKYKVTIN